MGHAVVAAMEIRIIDTEAGSFILGLCFIVVVAEVSFSCSPLFNIFDRPDDIILSYPFIL